MATYAKNAGGETVRTAGCAGGISGGKRMIDEKKLIEKIRYTNINIADDPLLLKITVLSLINEQPKVGEWIPVTERLPEELTEVNITWINRDPEPYYSDIKDKPFVGTGVIYKGIWHWSSATCVDILREYGENRFDEIEEGVDVTAWMPLPEPYKEEI